MVLGQTLQRGHGSINSLLLRKAIKGKTPWPPEPCWKPGTRSAANHKVQPATPSSGFQKPPSQISAAAPPPCRLRPRPHLPLGGLPPSSPAAKTRRAEFSTGGRGGGGVGGAPSLRMLAGSRIPGPDLKRGAPAGAGRRRGGARARERRRLRGHAARSRAGRRGAGWGRCEAGAGWGGRGRVSASAASRFLVAAGGLGCRGRRLGRCAAAAAAPAERWRSAWAPKAGGARLWRRRRRRGRREPTASRQVRTPRRARAQGARAGTPRRGPPQAAPGASAARPGAGTPRGRRGPAAARGRLCSGGVAGPGPS